MRLNGRIVEGEPLYAAVRRLAQQVYRPYRREQGRMMLQAYNGVAGITEVACPVCAEHPSWLDPVALEFCPICYGFQRVPQGLADWLTARLGEEFGGRRSRMPKSLRPAPRTVQHVCRREMPHRVHIPT
ncbi:MAG: hypothetical protein PVH68_14700 [Armatimonadota bacterium]|jgi:hypothetical protein